METGQQFLMLKNSININSKLSFHLFNDGFFFNSNSESNYFLFEDINILIENELLNFLKFNDINNSNEPKIVFFDSPSMFIPSKLHDHANSKQFLSNYTGLKSNHKIVFDITDDEKICVIYQVNKEIEKTLTKCFTKLNFKHYTSILYNNLKEYSKSNSDSIMKLFVNLQKDKFDLFLIKNQNLIAYNSFPQSNVDDFMYYIFSLIEQYKLSANSFDLLFLDRIEIFESYYSTIKNFHDKIIFIEKEEALKVNKDHPSPYFLNII